MTKNLLIILFVTLFGLTALTVWFSRGPGQSGEMVAENAADSEHSGTGKAAIGGAFSLVDHTGKEVTQENFRGKFMLVFFGFTHCPDICPTTLARLTNVMDQLGKKSRAVVPILISVDPDRDTPERLGEYLKSFHPSMVGLTGTREQIKSVADVYKAYYSKEEPPAEEAAEEHAGHAEHQGHEGMDHSQHQQESYMVNHSSFIYLMDRNGNYVTHFSPEDPEQKIAQEIRKHI